MPKSKRKILSNEKKIKIARLVVDGNCSASTVSRMFGVSYDTVSRAAKRKKELEDGIASGLINPKSKKKRKCTMPKVESKLIDWIQIARNWKFPITKQLIIAKAKAIAIEQMIINDVEKDSEEESNKIKFVASDGWFNNFKKRYSLHFNKIVGESGSSAINLYKEEMNRIQEKIAEYNPNHVYNMDEAAIFYKILPNFTYSLPTERNCRGKKQPKDRITIILCCNMTGTHKLLPAIVGSSVNPTCFKKQHVPVK